MNISALVQAHNEERNLPGCLESLTWVDELVVADHASTDATRSIALAAKARILDMPALGFVEPTRNDAIRQCAGDWIVLLDADERVSPLLAQRLRELSRTAEEAGFWIPRKDYFLGQWLEYGSWPNYQLRFFRRTKVTWPTLVHEHPQIDGKIGRLPADPLAALEHPGYADDLQRFVLKLVEAAPFDADRLAQTWRPPVWPYLVRRPLGEFLGRYLRGQAWRHGMKGLVWSMVAANYHLLVAMHYWAKYCPGDDGVPSPAKLRRSVRWHFCREAIKWLRG
jgi:glycosyltransferase involved in cell wall biosynthesis